MTGHQIDRTMHARVLHSTATRIPAYSSGWGAMRVVLEKLRANPLLRNVSLEAPDPSSWRLRAQFALSLGPPQCSFAGRTFRDAPEAVCEAARDLVQAGFCEKRPDLEMLAKWIARRRVTPVLRAEEDAGFNDPNPFAG